MLLWVQRSVCYYRYRGQCVTMGAEVSVLLWIAKVKSVTMGTEVSQSVTTG